MGGLEEEGKGRREACTRFNPRPGGGGRRRARGRLYTGAGHHYYSGVVILTARTGGKGEAPPAPYLGGAGLVPSFLYMPGERHSLAKRRRATAAPPSETTST